MMGNCLEDLSNTVGSGDGASVHSALHSGGHVCDSVGGKWGVGQQQQRLGVRRIWSPVATVMMLATIVILTSTTRLGMAAPTYLSDCVKGIAEQKMPGTDLEGANDVSVAEFYGIPNEVPLFAVPGYSAVKYYAGNDTRGPVKCIVLYDENEFPYITFFGKDADVNLAKYVTSLRGRGTTGQVTYNNGPVQTFSQQHVIITDGNYTQMRIGEVSGHNNGPDVRVTQSYDRQHNHPPPTRSSSTTRQTTVKIGPDARFVDSYVNNMPFNQTPASPRSTSRLRGQSTSTHPASVTSRQSSSPSLPESVLDECPDGGWIDTTDASSMAIVKNIDKTTGAPEDGWTKKKSFDGAYVYALRGEPRFFKIMRDFKDFTLHVCMANINLMH